MSKLVVSKQPAESIAALVARLGPPPTVVVEDWREQLIELLRRDAQASLTLSAHRLSVDAENRLSWIDADRPPLTTAAVTPTATSPLASVTPRTSAKDWDQLPPASQSAVQDFFGQVAAITPATAERPAAAKRPATSHRRATADRLRQPPKRTAKSSASRRLVLGGTSLAALTALVWAMNAPDDLQQGSPNSQDQTKHQTQSLAQNLAQSRRTGALRAEVDGEAAGENAKPAAPATRANAFAAEPLPSETLSTLDPLSADGLFPADALSIPRLDLPPSSTASPLNTSPNTNRPNTNRPLTHRPDATREPETGAAAESDAAPAEGLLADDVPRDDHLLPQADAAVRLRVGPGVTLPATDAVDQTVTLAEHPIATVVLQLPADKPALTIAQDADSRWSILADRYGDEPQRLARIESTATGTRWQWTTAAASAAAARQLANARLQLGSADGSRWVYLRPTMEIDPLPFGFQNLDERTVWPLGTAVAPTGATTQIDFDLPPDVQFAWIEPPGGQPPRRMRAVAQFALESDEFTALRIRMDVQTGARLSYRQRTAARLDVTLPWQLVSLPGLSQAADDLIANLGRQQQLLERVRAVYSDADYQQRKQIRPRRDQLQQQIEAMKATAERLSQLIRLLERLESEGAIRLELSTAWPDETQAILTTAEGKRP